MAPSFLEDVGATEDGYLWMKSEPKQKESPPLLPHAEKLWILLHPANSKFPRDCDAPPPPPVEELKPCPGLLVHSQQCVADIENMKVAKRDKSLRLSVNRLTQQQAARLSTHEVNQEEAYAEATLRVVRTLNSIRALFPLIGNMFSHSQKQDDKLEINVRDVNGDVTRVDTLQSVRAKKKNITLRVFLLGDYVYDTAKPAQIDITTKMMRQTLECFLPDEQAHSLLGKTTGDDDWATVLPQILEAHVRRRVTPLPQSLFVPERKEQVLSTAATCDDKYLHVFHHENQAAQRARALYQQAVDRLLGHLGYLLQRRYQGSEVRVYGSCLSNLSLGQSSDVDISLHHPAAALLKDEFAKGTVGAYQYERDMKHYVYNVHRHLTRQRNSGFVMRECVTRARVPVIKGTYFEAGNPYSPDGSLDFDLCFSNDIAVANSALLCEYTLVDERVKSFLLGVKAWAKSNKVSSAADNRISSYAWSILGIFYLQCIEFVPNLQCRQLMTEHGFQLDLSRNSQHCVNDLETGFLPWNTDVRKNVWKQPQQFKDTPVTLLLYGFFHFYAKHFPRSLYAVSVREGNVTLPKSAFGKCFLPNLCIEDPFETYSSHCPHDLGRPANYGGHRAIYSCLFEAERCLYRLLDSGDLETANRFWWVMNAAKVPQSYLHPAQALTMPPPPQPIDRPKVNNGRPAGLKSQGRDKGGGSLNKTKNKNESPGKEEEKGSANDTPRKPKGQGKGSSTEKGKRNASHQSHGVETKEPFRKEHPSRQPNGIETKEWTKRNPNNKTNHLPKGGQSKRNNHPPKNGRSRFQSGRTDTKNIGSNSVRSDAARSKHEVVPMEVEPT